MTSSADSNKVRSFVAERTELEDWVPADRITVLEGNPKQRGNVLWRDPYKRVSYGVWEVQPGKFRVVYGPWSELTDCIAGEATVTDEATGEVFHLKPGTRMIIPLESTVVWDVKETYRCVYSGYEPEWDPKRAY